MLNFTHRLLAWGVLGLATGGCLFSLLTLLFSGGIILKTQVRWESFAERFRFLRSVPNSFFANKLSRTQSRIAVVLAAIRSPQRGSLRTALNLLSVLPLLMPFEHP